MAQGGRSAALWLVAVVLGAGCATQAPAALPALEPAPAESAPLSVAFTWTPAEPAAGQPVVFQPSGTVREGLEVTSWQWAFGDGATSREGAPSHRFASAGLFTVTVTAHATGGVSATHSRTVAVSGGEAKAQPKGAEPAPAPPKVHAEVDELAVRFRYEWAAAADLQAWDFGDGTTSQEAAPAHSYEAPGRYTVRLSLLRGGQAYHAETTVEVHTSRPRFILSSVGREGAEPSVGVTSDGCIFFLAHTSTMRSCDGGATWTAKRGLLASPVDFDPYLWVDPATDRVFQANMIFLACTWLAWSDDGGDSWTGNPADCGPVPVNDHIKVATGPWTDANAALRTPVYPQAVYFCHNKLVYVSCHTSVDGGLTFPLGGRACNGGLHGAVEAAPDGTVYVPPRLAQPTVCYSKDNGITWRTATVPGGDTPDPRKNSEVATDTASNAYHAWVGADFGVRLSRSTDGGATWSTGVRAIPAQVTSATFVHAVAGDPGRVAVAYLGSEDHAGNPHTAPGHTHYHLYVTFSLDALAATPTFTTVRVTDDPVQVGSICIDSGDCRDGNRNLLDFMDLSKGPDGRVYVAYADGCTGSCATSSSRQPGQSRSAAGMVAILDTGPSLYADVGILKPVQG
ncbi:MAG TPA: PKD domain-containing protein [Candidatus Thermoplasmatota archaeon]|nr:PKD domain-containing protein [Candidatus Thermoplasmatota archaeon]